MPSTAAKLASGVGLAGQESEIQNVMNKITTDKNNKIADSFDKVFLLAAIILIATCFIGIFTDRKDANDTKTAIAKGLAKSLQAD
jgi:hypothetical protein